MRNPIRWPLVLMLIAALALPAGPALAGDQLAASAPVADVTGDTTPTTDTAGGVVMAMGCGFSVGLFGLSGSPLMLVLAVASCSFMIIDALATPD